MKIKKGIRRFVIVLETVLLAGMVLLSFYLLFQYIKEGEQAVSGTAVRIATSDSEEETGDGNSGETGTESGSESPDHGSGERELIQYTGEDSIEIHVRILDDDYEEDLFEEITVTASGGFTVERGLYDDTYAFVKDENKETQSFADDIYTAACAGLRTGEALRLTPKDGGTITVTSLCRADGSPQYSGELYIYRLEGGLALVNALDLEEYLYAVVSSEMPSYFPMEALKAQAVCARTYALLCIGNSKNEKSIADLDDSVRFQVYNNHMSTEASREAVDATRQVILSLDEVQYYSTSCLSEHRDDLNEEQAFRTFLSELPEEGAEYGSAWLRWEVEIPVSQVLNRLSDEYDIHAETLEEISVESRAGNGQAQLLRVVADGEILEIEGEYSIRQFLSPNEAEVVLMDGAAVSGMQLLPSAFFCLDPDESYADESSADDGSAGEVTEETEETAQAGQDDMDILHIYGGGYGHGNGMSQYGAAQMAADGASYLDILEYYYIQ